MFVTVYDHCPSPLVTVLVLPITGSHAIGGAKLVVRMVDTGTYRPGFGIYQVIERLNGEVVGDIGFHSAPNEYGSVEIGYGLVPVYRHRGIATEATGALVVWALDQPRVNAVWAETVESNVPSQNVLAKTGFELLSADGELRRYVRRRATP